MKVSHTLAVAMVKEYLRAQIVPYIVGSPGIGKSAIVKQIAKASKLKLIDVRLSQCDPTDLNAA